MRHKKKHSVSQLD